LAVVVDIDYSIAVASPKSFEAAAIDLGLIAAAIAPVGLVAAMRLGIGLAVDQLAATRLATGWVAATPLVPARSTVANLPGFEPVAAS